MRMFTKSILLALAILIAHGCAAPNSVFGATFMDVPADYWASNEISAGVEGGIVSGYTDQTFRPEDLVTYREFIKMAVVATGDDPGSYPGSDWAKNYVDAARERGLLRSLDGEVSRLDLSISRHHAAIVLADAEPEWEISAVEVKAAKALMVDIRKVKDVDPIARVLFQGLMQGYQDMKFRPEDPITRAEAVCVILRLKDGHRRLDVQGYLNEVAAIEKEEDPEEESEEPSLPWPGEEHVGRIDQDAFEAEAFRFTNIQRENAGKALLEYDDDLAAVAREKARDMVVNDYYNHISPTYGSPFEMMVQFGIKFSCAGENIAYGFNTPEGVVVDGWMESPPHKETMLSDRLTHIGIGCWDSGTRIYWVQMFIGQ